MGIRRYPGATPFSSDQARIFYGRDSDIQKMLTLIQVEKKVLLYSKSGLGKTSLLEAGVIPKLPINYMPVSIRLFASTKDAVSPVASVRQALKKVIDGLDKLPDTLLDQLKADDQKDSSLWYLFKKLQLAGLDKNEEGKQIIYLLVFDQFEELFSYSPAQILDFKNQLYELTEQRVPDRFAAQIAAARRNNKELFTREALATLHQRMDIKTVFAIRSDRLSLLNQLSDKITDIQQVYHEIKPLSNTQAIEAVVKPAADKDTVFETRPYTFHSDALAAIIHNLSIDENAAEKSQKPIETTQLQIVCHRIEEVAEAKYLKLANAKADTVIEIAEKDLPSFSNIFLDFYNDSIQKIEEGSRANAKRLIEDELIRSNQRISLDENICKDFINADQLKKLVDTHLLRAERNSFERFSFELCHDTLVNPILESRKQFKAEEQERVRELKRRADLEALKKKQKEERLAQEVEMKRLREEQERKDKERVRKLRQQRIITGIVAFFLLVSLGLGYWGYINFCEASEQRDIALLKEQDAQGNLINFMDAQYDNYFENAQGATKDADYTLAIQNYYEAIPWIHANIVSAVDTGSDCNIFTVLFSSQAEENYLKEHSKIYRAQEELAISDSLSKMLAVIDGIKFCERKASKKATIDSLHRQANSYMRKRNYIKALQLFREAYREDDNMPGSKQKFIDAKKEAVRMYEKSMDDYREIGDQAEWERAEDLLDQVNLIRL